MSSVGQLGASPCRVCGERMQAWTAICQKCGSVGADGDHTPRGLSDE